MEHTENELQIVKDYENAVDPDILSFVKEVLDGNDKINYVTVAFLSEEAAEKIRKITGQTVNGNRVVLDINAVRHIVKRHGENGKQDQSMRDLKDLARIGYVIMNYDDISFNGETSFNHVDREGKPSPMVQFSKRVDGTVYVVQTAGTVKSRRNYVVTAYKKKKQPPNP